MCAEVTFVEEVKKLFTEDVSLAEPKPYVYTCFVFGDGAPRCRTKRLITS